MYPGVVGAGENMSGHQFAFAGKGDNMPGDGSSSGRVCAGTGPELAPLQLSEADVFVFVPRISCFWITRMLPGTGDEICGCGFFPPLRPMADLNLENVGDNAASTGERGAKRDRLAVAIVGVLCAPFACAQKLETVTPLEVCDG